MHLTYNLYYKLVEKGLMMANKAGLTLHSVTKASEQAKRITDRWTQSYKANNTATKIARYCINNIHSLQTHGPIHKHILEKTPLAQNNL